MYLLFRNCVGDLHADDTHIRYGGVIIDCPHSPTGGQESTAGYIKISDIYSGVPARVAARVESQQLHGSRTDGVPERVGAFVTR